MCVWEVCVTIQLLDAHLGNGTGCKPVTIMEPLLLPCGSVKNEAVFHSFETSQVGGLVLICDSGHSWLLYSATSLEHQASGTMTCYPTQSHYPDTEITSPCPILVMLSARLGGDKYHWFDSTRGRKRARYRLKPVTFGFPDLPEREAGTLLIRPPQCFVVLFNRGATSCIFIQIHCMTLSVSGYRGYHIG